MESFALIFALSILNATTNAVATRISVSDPAASLCRFANYENNGRVERFLLNTNFWLKGIDFSCVSPWNSRGGRCRAGTAISPRHVVFAAHFPLAVGDRLVFVGEDDGVCPCRIAKTKRIEATDIMIGSLDYELTSNIKPAKILPSEFEKKIGNYVGMPVVTFNQNEKVYLAEVRDTLTNGLMRTLRLRIPNDFRWRDFNEPLVSGDSGNPAFLLVGNEPVLLHCLRGGGVGSGPSIYSRRKEIQKVMDELCPGYKLEEFDFQKLKEKNDDKHDSR